MASEISMYGKLAVTKGSLSLSRENSSKIDMAGTHVASGAVDVPTTTAGTALGMANVGTAGCAYFRNLDAVNYIELGVQVSGAFYPFAKLKPAESFVVRLGISAPYARAHTATAILEYQILED